MEEQIKAFINSLGEPFEVVKDKEFWGFDYPVSAPEYSAFTLKWQANHPFTKDFIFSRHFNIVMIDFERKGILVQIPTEVLFYTYGGPAFVEEDESFPDSSDLEIDPDYV